MRRFALVLFAAAVLALPAAAAQRDAIVKNGPNIELRDAFGRRHVLTPPLARGERRLDTMAVASPDGSRVVFVRYTPRQRAIFTVAPDGTNLRAIRLFETTEKVESLAWSPDGSSIVVGINGFKPGYVERIGIVDRYRMVLWTFPGVRWGTVQVYGWAGDGHSVRFAAVYGDAGPSVLMTGDELTAETHSVARSPGLPPRRWASLP